MRYCRGEVAGLDSAIAIQRSIFTIRNPRAPEYVGDLDLLAALLRERYEVYGDSHLEDLAEACAFAAEAIKLTRGDGRIERIVALADLFEVRASGKATRTVDYERVIELREHALELVPPSCMLVVARQAELIATLVQAVKAGRSPSLLDRAVEVSERMLERVGAADRAQALKTLFTVLRLRGSGGDIDRAVDVAAEGLRLDPECADRRCDLALALSIRKASIYDLDRAIALIDCAIRTAPVDTPYTVTARRKGALAKLRADRFRVNMLSYTRFAGLPLRSHSFPM